MKDCCAHCAETHSIVKRFKDGKDGITRNCRFVSSVLLLKIDKNVLYDEGVFEQKQASHRRYIKQRFQTAHQNIKQTMKELHVNFKDGGTEVQREWRELVKKTDEKVEQALRTTVKRSLQELSRSINGDAKTEVTALFGVKIVLENNRVDYRPTMINLTHVVNIVAKELISTVAVVPRLKEALAADDGAAGEGADAAPARPPRRRSSRCSTRSSRTTRTCSRSSCR